MTPEIPSDPTLQTLRLPSGPMTFTDEGSGPTLVAVHGLPGSVRDYRWLAPALDGVRFIRLDLPGFGGTPWQTGSSPGNSDRASLVSDALSALSVDDVVLMGHSFGGVVATEVATRDERVRGLALLASPGLRPHRAYAHGGNWRLIKLGLLTPIVRRLMMKPLRNAYVRAGFPRSTPDEVLVRTALCVASVDLAAHACRLRELSLPTLVAWAADDKLVEVAIGDALDAELPAGPRLRFTEGGHNIQKTQAMEIGRALSSWTTKQLTDHS